MITEPDPERLVEALLFAQPDPISAATLATVQARYTGLGVELMRADGGWMFRTAADLGPLLVRVVERKRRLPRTVRAAGVAELADTTPHTLRHTAAAWVVQRDVAVGSSRDAEQHR